MKKKTLVLGAAGALAVAGGGAGVAASADNSPKEESQAVIDDAAKQLGVTPNALGAALKTALKNRIDAAVAAGRLSKEQGDELKERIEAGDVPLFGGIHRAHFAHFGGLDAAASYLGLSEAQLRDELAGGKTLAEVAEDRGKSVDGLVQAMTDAVQERLDAAVAAGRLTRAQADSVLADVRERITDIVNGKAPRFRSGFRFHGFGERFFGPPPF